MTTQISCFKSSITSSIAVQQGPNSLLGTGHNAPEHSHCFGKYDFLKSSFFSNKSGYLLKPSNSSLIQISSFSTVLHYIQEGILKTNLLI